MQGDFGIFSFRFFSFQLFQVYKWIKSKYVTYHFNEFSSFSFAVFWITSLAIPMRIYRWLSAWYWKYLEWCLDRTRVVLLRQHSCCCDGDEFELYVVYVCLSKQFLDLSLNVMLLKVFLVFFRRTQRFIIGPYGRLFSIFYWSSFWKHLLDERKREYMIIHFNYIVLWSRCLNANWSNFNWKQSILRILLFSEQIISALCQVFH